MEKDPFIEAMMGHLPDSRCRDRELNTLHTPHGEAVPTFCANCGKQEGYAVGNVQRFIGICDECTAKIGRLPLPEIPPEEIRGMYRRDQG